MIRQQLEGHDTFASGDSCFCAAKVAPVALSIITASVNWLSDKRYYCVRINPQIGPLSRTEQKSLWPQAVFRETLTFRIIFISLGREIARQTWIEISYIQRDLITVIFYYQISLKPLKTLSLSQVSFPLLFPLYYIVPWVFTNSDKGKNKGKKIL